MEPICDWFYFCDGPAIGTTPHPTLGDVFVCRRCASRLKLVVTPFEGGRDYTGSLTTTKEE